MVCESRYSGWFNTINLAYDPKPLLEASIEEFKTLIKKKNRYIISNQHPVIFPGKYATNFEPYSSLGSELLNERANIVYKNKTLADKFKHLEIDRQLDKEDFSSQDNIFPESKANLFSEFGQGDTLRSFHEKKTWKEKYQVALTVKDPRASFMLKKLIFDESPEILLDNDFKLVHRELHDRLVLNQERPYTTIPEAMTQLDTELSKIEDDGSDNKENKIRILNEYNQYLIFLEKYFSNKNAVPLESGINLLKQIYND